MESANSPRIALAFIGFVLIAFVAVLIVRSGDDRPTNAAGPGASETSDPKDEHVVVGSGDFLVASESVNDWAKNSDLVVVASVVEESPHKPADIEVERGEGLVGRDVTLSVNQTVWARKGAPPVGDSVEISAPGWVFNSENFKGQREFALEGMPRMEVGHEYVVALAWREAITPEMVAACGGGDDKPEPAHWETIGDHGVIPFDGDQLGAGEFEGRDQSLADAREEADQARSRSAGRPISFRDQVVGKDVAAVRSQLEAVGAETSRVPKPTPECRNGL